MAVEARTFALAAYLYGRGHTPIRAVVREGRVVFEFPDRAREHVASYLATRELLADFERRARRQPRERTAAAEDNGA